MQFHFTPFIVWLLILSNNYLFTQGENADENEAQLDEEMEKVFSEPSISKFDVRRLSDVKPPSSSKNDKEYQQSQQAHNEKRYNEQDYDCKWTTLFTRLAFGYWFSLSPFPAHRKNTYQQPHAPLKAIRSMNRQTSKESNPTLTKKESTETPASPVSASDSDGGGYGNDTVSRPSNFSSYADYTSRDVSEDIDDEDPPPLSERVSTYHDDDDVN